MAQIGVYTIKTNQTKVQRIGRPVEKNFNFGKLEKKSLDCAGQMIHRISYKQLVNICIRSPNPIVSTV